MVMLGRTPVEVLPQLTAVVANFFAKNRQMQSDFDNRYRSASFVFPTSFYGAEIMKNCCALVGAMFVKEMFPDMSEIFV